MLCVLSRIMFFISALQEALIAFELDFDTLAELRLALDEIVALVNVRKIHFEDGLQASLSLLFKMKQNMVGR